LSSFILRQLFLFRTKTVSYTFNGLNFVYVFLNTNQGL